LKYNNEVATVDELYQNAGIFIEFGKIVCISCGFINGNGVRLTSFYGEDKKILLQEFAHLQNKHY